MQQQFQIERERQRVGGGCQFAMIHEGAPRPTRRFGNTPTTRRRLTDMWKGPHVNETWCVISRAKCDLAVLARGAALVIGLYFFNGAPFSFEARLTSTIRRENINYSTTTPPLVLVV